MVSCHFWLAEYGGVGRGPGCAIHDIGTTLIKIRDGNNREVGNLPRNLYR